jgi:O-antigen ligase
VLPLSTEYYFSNGFSTDLPDEPLMIFLTGVTFVKLFAQPSVLKGFYVRHTIFLLLFLHFAWMTFCIINSDDVIVSLKFFLAKIWYVTAWFVLPLLLIRKDKDVYTFLWCMLLPLAPATVKIILHHAMLNFGFREINIAVFPFFRNHVNYAAHLSLMLPFAWFVIFRQKRFSMIWIIAVSIFSVMFLGVALAYTRAAYLALALAVGAYFGIRWRLMKYAIGAGLIAVIAGLSLFINNNKFMDYAPTEKTVAHEEFGDIVNATSRLEDASTMERYYRWVAAARMSSERPLTGFGLFSFHEHYKHYALSRFRTYLSDNLEKSGVHCYFLMTLIDQGYPGLIIFLLLLFGFLLVGERVYHQSLDPYRKGYVMGALLSSVVIYAFLLINDLVESDKVGTVFFLNMALVMAADRFNKSEM